MKYSVIVPVYNRPDEVAELLESLTSQTYKDFEVIIVEGRFCRSPAKTLPTSTAEHLTFIITGRIIPDLDRVATMVLSGVTVNIC
jgi:cellulose synthase/poly-beta-1,6-N-acetylglucosamine synthase-like glycosyltransferase